jgi:hypothetical protein
MKILPVGAELFHADRQKDRHDEAKSRIYKLNNKNNLDRLRLDYMTSELHTRTLTLEPYCILLLGFNFTLCNVVLMVKFVEVDVLLR